MSSDGWKKGKLSQVCIYGKDKININDLQLTNYISTENMLPEKAGVTIANGLPRLKTLSAYKIGDVLVSNIRPYFKKIWFANKNGGCSNDVLVFRAKRNIYDSKFLYYNLSYDSFFDYSMSTSKGTKMPRGDKSALMNYIVPLIQLPEQKAIAATLSCLDDMIELNNRTNQVLEEMAQAIFKAWFVDFEFPDENGQPYKSSGGKMVESELGEIPEGWKVGNLLEIANYTNGLAMQKYRPKKAEKGIPVLKIKELRQGQIDQNSELCSRNIARKYIVEDGDMVFSWSGSLLVDFWCGGECGLNQHLFKVTSDKYGKWFYYFWTVHHLEKFIGIAKDKTTTMGHIKRDDLANAKVIVPSARLYNDADSIFTPIIGSIISSRVENRILQNIRDTLLPKLISGEIRVPIEEVV